MDRKITVTDINNRNNKDEIELIYNPPGLKLGIYISLGTLILTTCYLMCKKRTK